MKLDPSPHHLEVFHEGRRRREVVGSLAYDPKAALYTFTYDAKYLRKKTAIPVGPEMPLTRPVHKSQKHKLFPSLLDRIPSKENPAYAEYCEAAGIDPHEVNLIVLLTAIGKRGPSTFIFESVYEFDREALVAKLKSFRQNLDISLWELAAALDIPYLTLQRIENGKSKDTLTMRLLYCYLTFPEPALWQLRLSGRYVNHDALVKLVKAVTKPSA
ncbi:MAG: HipA N-terminal domain-containing protein [Proteobacteria bacterium]|nr:HipA N-terminal domain-containing protein [Pseudomonadota bacterium]